MTAIIATRHTTFPPFTCKLRFARLPWRHNFSHYESLPRRLGNRTDSCTAIALLDSSLPKGPHDILGLSKIQVPDRGIRPVLLCPKFSRELKSGVVWTSSKRRQRRTKMKWQKD
jgi:hypothetical protein